MHVPCGQQMQAASGTSQRREAAGPKGKGEGRSRAVVSVGDRSRRHALRLLCSRACSTASAVFPLLSRVSYATANASVGARHLVSSPLPASCILPPGLLAFSDHPFMSLRPLLSLRLFLSLSPSSLTSSIRAARRQDPQPPLSNVVTMLLAG